jgi:hypothetical protein
MRTFVHKELPTLVLELWKNVKSDGKEKWVGHFMVLLRNKLSKTSHGEAK